MIRTFLPVYLYFSYIDFMIYIRFRFNWRCRWLTENNKTLMCVWKKRASQFCIRTNMIYINRPMWMQCLSPALCPVRSRISGRKKWKFRNKHNTFHSMHFWPTGATNVEPPVLGKHTRKKLSHERDAISLPRLRGNGAGTGDLIRRRCATTVTIQLFIKCFHGR